MGKIKNFIAHAWNAFTDRKSSYNYYGEYGHHSSSIRPDRNRLSGGNEKTIATSVFNRIALDVAAVDIRHVVEDADGRFQKFVLDGLDDCLNLEANIDQTGKAFIQDIVISMLDEGCVAVVPVDTDIDPKYTSGFNIESMRVGKILVWYPDAVRVRLYNDRRGIYEELVLPKSKIGIIENPLYAVINEPNGTYKRLIRKLALLDELDFKNAAGKLDLIIQLPYVIKNELKREQAEQRRKQIEQQLDGSKYGIAYIDGTEKVTQMNRPVDNNLLSQIEYLTKSFQTELGITPEIMNGTADEAAMINYFNRTTEPIVRAIADEFKRKFLSKTARTKGHNLAFNRNPFRLMPLSQMAETADKFTRNEILTSNEFRGLLGFRPADDPKADQLVNSNIAQDNMGGMPGGEQPTESGDMSEELNQVLEETLDDVLGQIDEMIQNVNGEGDE